MTKSEYMEIRRKTCYEMAMKRLIMDYWTAGEGTPVLFGECPSDLHEYDNMLVFSWLIDYGRFMAWIRLELMDSGIGANGVQIGAFYRNPKSGHLSRRSEYWIGTLLTPGDGPWENGLMKADYFLRQLTKSNNRCLDLEREGS